MVPEVDLEQLETEVREARDQHPAEIGRVGTHWQGCWTLHPLCALPIVETLLGQLREAGARQVTLDRIIVDRVLRKTPPALDDAQKAEIVRIAEKWEITL